jgi:hypothetical protein
VTLLLNRIAVLQTTLIALLECWKIGGIAPFINQRYIFKGFERVTKNIPKWCIEFSELCK